MRKWAWLAVFAVVVLGGVTIWVVYVDGYYGRYGKIDTAQSQAGFFVKQCQAYRARNPESKYPARLLELVEPPEGMMAIVDGGPAELIDPWGNPYKYALVETEAGPVPHVWVEREINGRLQLFGARVGKRFIFGTPK